MNKETKKPCGRFFNYHKWKELSYVHRVCLKCGRMEYKWGVDSSGFSDLWDDWITKKVNTYGTYGVPNPQPKTAEGYFAEAKDYQNIVDAQITEKKKEKEHAKELTQQAFNLINVQRKSQ